MNKKYQNLFFIFGLLVLVIMITRLHFSEVWRGLQHAGYWFWAVLVLWGLLYVLNTASWWLIIRGVCGGNPSQRSTDKELPGASRITFAWLYKVTVSGFALNYATPGGLMGGEPYRIMELAPHIGTERASSSVILYVMTHIFSHFWFWLLSAIGYVVMRPITVVELLLAIITVAFCALGLWLFMVGYRKGLAARVMKLLGYIPVIKRWATPFVQQHRAQLDEVDARIAALHTQNPVFFVTSVFLELLCRILSSFEIYFILLVLYPHVNFEDCVLILAFTSLFANMLFFIPLQLGGREGGFLMSVSALGLGSSAGIFVALIVRIRELIWTGLGLLLIKLGHRS